MSSRRCIAQFRSALSKHDKDMASTLSVGQQMICMLATQDLVSAVHRHVGLPDNLLSAVEFRSYGAGGGKSSFLTGFLARNSGSVSSGRAVGYMARMRRFLG